MTKKKIIEIVITALVSAGIAFLTNLLSQLTNTWEITANPEVAGAIGGTIHAIRKFMC